MKKSTLLYVSAALCAGLLAAPVANAMEKGDWLVRVGASNVGPKDSNGPVVDVKDGTSPTFNASYFLTSNWSIEVLAATPFSHDIYLVDGPKVGETDHLPPTVSLNYHFFDEGTALWYAGIGFNYTKFFDEDTTGPLTGADLDLDSSTGLAFQIGVDIMLQKNWALNLNLRWIDIETEGVISVPGDDPVNIGDIRIDPFVWGFHLGYRF